MSRHVGVREFRNNLSAYIAQAKAGEPVTIVSRGNVVAELRAPPAPVTPQRARIRFGTMKGEIVFHEGWDRWTEEELAEFEKPLF